ncbi:VapE domain-containing protein [Mesorhizobium australicum]|uniref:VapE domain-containing protein n=1 Tax=Mesorhizobium australicum TaxID=536018 RepID=UPI00333CB579
MRSDSSHTFGGSAAAFIHAGFPATDILPLIPPGAQLSQSSQVSPIQVGKIPGRFRDGVWSGLTGQWAAVGLDSDTVSAAQEWPTENVGLRSASFPAIDIDTATDEARALVESVVVSLFGEGLPVRFRPDAPRALYPFRLKPGGEAVRKRRLVWTDKRGFEHGLDVLGHGQQYVIAGRHPKGGAYQWRDGKSLVSVGADNLPSLTGEDVAAFNELLTEAILADGGTIVSAAASAGSATDYEVTVRDADPAWPDAMALEALNTIPNKSDTLPTRENLVAVLSSFKAATGRNADALAPDAEAWAVRHGWADSEYFWKIWDSILVSRVPPDHLAHVARRHGWDGAAQLAQVDFADLGADVELLIERHSSGALALPVPEKAPADLATVVDSLRQHAPDVFKYDEMRRTTMVMKPPTRAKDFKPRPVEDNDAAIVQEFLQRGGLRRVGKSTVIDAIELVARENAFHPVRDWLRATSWDGVERLPRLFPDYFGSENNEYTRAIGPMLLISMVARVMKPGAKVDHMVVLEGMQGSRKSTAVKVLGGDWFSDGLPDITSKDASQHLRGKWLIEVAEMHAVNKAEANALKSFLTRSEESYRPSYGRYEVHEPRQVVFIGTTNETEYLRDATGARRFWPVRTAEIDTDALARDRDQLFAEALARYKRGEKWWPEGDFETRVMRQEQEERFEADIWEEPVRLYLADKDRVTTAEVASNQLGIGAVANMGMTDQRRLGAIFRRLGWEKKKSMGTISWVRASAPASTRMGAA